MLADLREENLESAPLVLACSPYVTTIDRQRDGCRRLCWRARRAATAFLSNLAPTQSVRRRIVATV
jgi:hypothetical protein